MKPGPAPPPRRRDTLRPVFIFEPRVRGRGGSRALPRGADGVPFGAAGGPVRNSTQRGRVMPYPTPEGVLASRPDTGTGTGDEIQNANSNANENANENENANASGSASPAINVTGARLPSLPVTTDEIVAAVSAQTGTAAGEEMDGDVAVSLVAWLHANEMHAMALDARWTRVHETAEEAGAAAAESSAAAAARSVAGAGTPGHELSEALRVSGPGPGPRTSEHNLAPPAAVPISKTPSTASVASITSMISDTTLTTPPTPIKTPGAAESIWTPSPVTTPAPSPVPPSVTAPSTAEGTATDSGSGAAAAPGLAATSTEAAHSCAPSGGTPPTPSAAPTVPAASSSQTAPTGPASSTAPSASTAPIASTAPAETSGVTSNPPTSTAPPAEPPQPTPTAPYLLQGCLGDEIGRNLGRECFPAYWMLSICFYCGSSLPLKRIDDD